MGGTNKFEENCCTLHYRTHYILVVYSTTYLVCMLSTIFSTAWLPVTKYALLTTSAQEPRNCTLSCMMLLMSVAIPCGMKAKSMPVCGKWRSVVTSGNKSTTYACE